MSGSNYDKDHVNGNLNNLITQPLTVFNENIINDPNTIVKNNGNLKESISQLLQEAYNLRKKNLFKESITI